MEKTQILIIEAEDTFSELLGQRLPPAWSLSFAVDPADAAQQVQAQRPHLLVVNAEQDTPALRQLLAGQPDARIVGLAQPGSPAPLSQLCHRMVPSDSVAQLTEVMQQLLQPPPAAPPPPPSPPATGAAAAPAHDPRLDEMEQRLERLEARVGEVATGTTGGLAELLQTTDGIGQGLKVQAKALAELERRMATQPKAAAADHGAAAGDAAEENVVERLDSELMELAERVRSVEARLTDLATGITSGLSELLIALDGVQQGLKVQGKALEQERAAREALEARLKG